MASSGYSFIDVAVVDPIRERYAAGDALIIISAALDEVIWANGTGAALLGYPSIEAALGAKAGLSAMAKRQIAAIPGFPRIGQERSVTIRLATGLKSQAFTLSASQIRLPDGEEAILLALPAPGAAGRSIEELAERAVSGFVDAEQFAAMVADSGRVIAASRGFREATIPEEAIVALVTEVAREPDRLVKRRLPVGGRQLPAAIARLRDDPLLALLIVVNEEEAASEPAAAETDGSSGETEELQAAVQSVEAAEVEAPASDRSVAEAKLASSPVRDDWYFGVRSQDSNANEKRVPESVWQPIRFIWRTDAEGRLTTISEEFCRTVGLSADSLLGRTFMEITAHLGIDPDGEIANLLKRRDTWSGRTVLWPLADGTQCIPVDLAALPAYSRERRFEGFRGFGVARPGEARAWEGTSFTLSSAREVKDAAEDMAPSVPSDERKEKPATAEKVIRLHDHRQPVAERGLSPVERIAFREIGERLREDAERFKDGTASENRQGANSPEAVTAPMAPFPPEGSSAALDEPTGTGAGEASHPAETAGPDADQFQKTAKAPFTTQTETRQDRDETLPAEVQPADGLLEEEVPRVEEGLSEAAVIPSAFAVAAPAADGAEPAILQRLPVPLIIFGADRLHFANRAFLSLTGYSDLETLEKAGGLAALFADLPAEDGTQAERIIAIRDSDGRTIPAQAQLQSVPWQDGKALLIVLRSADQDVESSARVDRAAERAEAALEDMLARVAEMQTIVDTATDGIVLIAQDGTIRSISRPAEALFGFDSATVTGRPFASLFAVESQRAARDYLNSLAEGGVASVLNDGREVIGREAHGRFIPLFMTIGKLPGDAGYCAVLRDITPWKRAEEELTKARAEAERASSQKTEFLARISHEIRTPLNAIIGFSELMLDEKFGPIGNERYRDYLRDINRSGNHVLDLVNDLLDISKIEAGAQELSYEAVALNEALAEAVALMQPQANRERVIIRSSFATDLPEVVADLRSIRQIALNLLSNAVRYTQAGGQVIVSTAYEPNGDVVLRVRDTGIGMTRAEIEEAMKPFKQLNTLKRSRGDGTGLGLPLTKALAEANRANFAMHSTPGEGTLVEITFPSTRVLAK